MRIRPLHSYSQTLRNWEWSLGGCQHFLDLILRLSGGEGQEGLWRGCFSPRGQIHLASWRRVALGESQNSESPSRVGEVGDTLASESPSQLLCKLGYSPSANHRPFCLSPQPLPILVHAPLSRIPNKSMTGVVPFLLSPRQV